MKYKSLNVNVQNCKLLLFSLLLFYLADNILCKNYRPSNQLEVLINKSRMSMLISRAIQWER